MTDTTKNNPFRKDGRKSAVHSTPTTSKECEALGGYTKVKPAPAHFSKREDRTDDSLNKEQAQRVGRKIENAVIDEGSRARQARNAGPHGKLIDAQGRSDDKPKVHSRTSGAN